MLEVKFNRCVFGGSHASCMVSCTADDDHSKIHIGKIHPYIYLSLSCTNGK